MNIRNGEKLARTRRLNTQGVNQGSSQFGCQTQIPPLRGSKPNPYSLDGLPQMVPNLLPINNSTAEAPVRGNVPGTAGQGTRLESVEVVDEIDEMQRRSFPRPRVGEATWACTGYRLGRLGILALSRWCQAMGVGMAYPGGK